MICYVESLNQYQIMISHLVNPYGTITIASSHISW
jgi:hypothetical protein